MRRRRGTELLGGVSLGDRLQVITRLRRVRQSIACLIIGFRTCIGSSRTNCSTSSQSYSCAGLSSCTLQSYTVRVGSCTRKKSLPEHLVLIYTGMQMHCRYSSLRGWVRRNLRHHLVILDTHNICIYCGKLITTRPTTAFSFDGFLATCHRFFLIYSELVR